ncbi:hypothetical protein FLP41_10040 [Paracoccus marcusii]|nr:hypothetical protein FLP41_10040 [Paracoccus marcusii]
MSVLGELDGVADQVHDDLFQPRRIAQDRRHIVAGIYRHQLVARRLCLRLQTQDRRIDQAAQVDRVPGQNQLTAARPRGVQHIVDMAQQHAAGMLHRGDVLSLAVVQFGQAQQVQQAQNAVQGSASMAHHGDHARLGLFARDGAVTGLDQFGLLGRASGHVAHKGDHQRSVLSSGDRHGQFDGDDPA